MVRHNKSTIKAFHLKEVNKVLAFMETKDITQTNRLLLAAGQIVAKRLGVKKQQRKEKVVRWWKRRLNGQVAQLREDISRLERKNSDDVT